MTAEARHVMSVALTSNDMGASVRFYRDQLGFEMKESWPDAENPMWCNMVLHGQSVMLGAAMEPEKVAEFCGEDEQAAKFHGRRAKDFQAATAGAGAGVGLAVYVMVDDIDGYAAQIREKGVEIETEPKDQFYGIRDTNVTDPTGYQLTFFSPIKLETCQSCAMPLADAAPGQMYCGHCTNDAGELKSYEEVFEGTVVGFFMGMQKMDRASAEAAAKEHLAKMPAWGAHC